MSQLNRRTILGAAAWTAPIVAIGAPAPALAASAPTPQPDPCCVPVTIETEPDAKCVTTWRVRITSTSGEPFPPGTTVTFRAKGRHLDAYPLDSYVTRVVAVPANDQPAVHVEVWSDGERCAHVVLPRPQGATRCGDQAGETR